MLHIKYSKALEPVASSKKIILFMFPYISLHKACNPRARLLAVDIEVFHSENIFYLLRPHLQLTETI